MTRPVRVLFDIHPRTIGGTEQFLARFLPRLDRARYVPVVVSSRAGAPLRALSSAGIQTAVVPEFFSPRGVVRLADVIRRRGVGLVQSNYYSFQLALAARLAAVPHVWRLGGHVAYGSRARSRADVGSTLAAIRLLSSAVICNSAYVRRQFAGRARRPPIHVIWNGVTRMASGPRLPRPVNLVAMAAHFTPQKRHEDFVRASARIQSARPDVSFAIFGETYGHLESRRYAQTIRRLASQLLGNGGITFAKFSPDERTLWQACDLVVLTSIGESFSNALLEAMAAAIPVVAVRSGGTPEIVAHRRTGLLVPPKAPGALASAVSALIDNPNRLRRYGRAGQTRARTMFSMARCVRRYQGVYARVLRDAAIS